VHLRAISTALFALCLGVVGACDDTKDAKVDAKAKADEKKADADEKKADAKADEAKADAKADEAKADEAKAEDAKAEDAKADAKAEDAKVDAKADAKAEDPKKPDAKTDPKKTEPKGTDTKASDSKVEIDSKSIYDKKCKTCHGATGNADTKIGKENDIPDWTVAGWKAKWPEAKVIDIVKNGKSGTKMKPFKDKLTEDEIVAVSKYSRTLGK
jgi:mono/diheme cytochrome c family protein